MKKAKRFISLMLVVLTMVSMLAMPTASVSAASVKSKSINAPKSITITENRRSDKLTWKKVAGATKYTVYYRMRLIGNWWTSWQPLGNTKSTFYKVSGSDYYIVRYTNMLPGTQYGVTASKGKMKSSVCASETF